MIHDSFTLWSHQTDSSVKVFILGRLGVNVWAASSWERNDHMISEHCDISVGGRFSPPLTDSFITVPPPPSVSLLSPLRQQHSLDSSLTRSGVKFKGWEFSADKHLKLCPQGHSCCFSSFSSLFCSNRPTCLQDTEKRVKHTEKPKYVCVYADFKHCDISRCVFTLTRVCVCIWSHNTQSVVLRYSVEVTCFQSKRKKTKLSTDRSLSSSQI